MTAPTLAEIVEQVAKALADDWNPERDPVLTAMFRDYANTAVTTTLRALEPLATEWEADAKEYDQRADEAFSDGGRELAANVYRAIANTNARHALQMRDVIGGIKQ